MRFALFFHVARPVRGSSRSVRIVEGRPVRNGEAGFIRNVEAWPGELWECDP